MIEFKSVSTGIKRLVATILTPLITTLQASPDPISQIASIVLSGIAASLGLVGVVQGAAGGSLKKYAIASSGSLVAILLAFLPSDSSYRPLINQIALILAGSALGSKYGETVEKKNQIQNLQDTLNGKISDSKSL